MVEHTNTDELTAQFVEQIETRLREAHLVFINASAFVKQSLADRSVEMLLDIEPLINEAKALLEAMTILRRSG